jgi:hypothetical protein
VAIRSLIRTKINFDASSRYNRAPMATPFGEAGEAGEAGEPQKVYNKGLKSI